MAGTSQKRRANFSSTSRNSKRSKRPAPKLDVERWHVDLGVPSFVLPKGKKGKRIKKAPGLDPQKHVRREINKFDEGLSVDYAVHFKGAYDAWTADGMRSYSKFELPEQTRIAVNDVVYIRHEDSIPEQMDVESHEDAELPSDTEKDVKAGLVEDDSVSPSTGGHINGSTPGTDGSRRRDSKIKAPKAQRTVTPRDWVAQVLECRAAHPAAVYLRVFWLYRPEDLPGGAQPHHGEDEVIPSNHMEIIEAATVQGTVEGMNKWDEYNDDAEERTYRGLIWRQTYNYLTGEFSKLRQYCTCGKPATPEEQLIGCSNPACDIWMHQECIAKQARRDAALQTLSRTENPDVTTRPATEEQLIIPVAKSEAQEEDEDPATIKLESISALKAGNLSAELNDSLVNKIGTKVGRWFAAHRKFTPPSQTEGEENEEEENVGMRMRESEPNGVKEEEEANERSQPTIDHPTNLSATRAELVRESDDKNNENTPAATPARRRRAIAGWRSHPRMSLPDPSEYRRRRVAAAKSKKDLEAAEKEWTAEVVKDNEGIYRVRLIRRPTTAIGEGGRHDQQRLKTIKCLKCNSEII